MKIQQATRLRILQLAQERGMTINKLAEKSGVAPSTLKYTVCEYARVKNTGVVTLQKLCQALGITIQQFFDSPLFEQLEPEEETE